MTIDGLYGHGALWAQGSSLHIRRTLCGCPHPALECQLFLVSDQGCVPQKPASWHMSHHLPQIPPLSLPASSQELPRMQS